MRDAHAFCRSRYLVAGEDGNATGTIYQQLYRPVIYGRRAALSKGTIGPILSFLNESSSTPHAPASML